MKCVHKSLRLIQCNSVTQGGKYLSSLGNKLKLNGLPIWNSHTHMYVDIYTYEFIGKCDFKKTKLAQEYYFSLLITDCYQFMLMESFCDLVIYLYNTSFFLIGDLVCKM